MPSFLTLWQNGSFPPAVPLYLLRTSGGSGFIDHLQTPFPRFPVGSAVSGDGFGTAAEGFCPPEFLFSVAFPLFRVLNFCCLHSGTGGAAERKRSLPGWEPGPCGKQKGPLSRLEESPPPLGEVRSLG